MEQAIYLLVAGFFVTGIGYFTAKLFDWNQKRIADKYQTNLAHFLSDLYRLQMKWSGAGEFGYSESLSNLIILHGKVSSKVKDGGIGLPITAEAASNNLQLKNLRKQELREVIEEVIEDQAFVG